MIIAKAPHLFGRTAKLLFTICALIFVATASQAAAASPAVWTIEQEAFPTYFAPGSSAGGGDGINANQRLQTTIVNIGESSASGAVITDVLPAGTTAASGPEPTIQYRELISAIGSGEAIRKTESCAVNNSGAASEVTCTVPANVAIGPGESIVVSVPVDVSATADGAGVNVLSISSQGTRTISNRLESPVSLVKPTFGIGPGVAGLSGEAVDPLGEPSPAGTHPMAVILRAHVPTIETAQGAKSVEQLRSLFFSLPEGLVANPLATPRCSFTTLNSETKEPSETCAPNTQVGLVSFFLNSNVQASSPLYNLKPPAGVPAEFAFGLDGVNVHVRGGLDGSFHLTAGSEEIFTKYAVNGVSVELWGNPSAESHDTYRRGGVEIPPTPGCREIAGPCRIERTLQPFLTMPSACSDSMTLGVTGSGWLGSPLAAETVFTTPSGQVATVTGCERLQFAPSVSIEPSTSATASPSGIRVRLKVPQTASANTLATATVKNVSVQLPRGMTVDPSAADGLGACSQSQIGLGTTSPAICTPSSRVGSAEIVTPLLEKPLSGSIYLAEPTKNPFGTLLALYLAVEGEGVVIKLPGRVDADPATGQLTATFDDNPELPFSELNVEFNGGPRATLETPESCGTYTTRTEITSWASSTPVVLDSPFTISQNCSTGGFSPRLEAGTTNPTAGSYSPFLLRVTRSDGEQNLSGISTTLPEGLVARLAGVPLCPASQAGSGNCPATSQVGTTTTGVGAGSQPLFIPQSGKSPTAVYLAGPYKGAPYSLVVKVPAQAGPFDLGTIAVRVALEVDPFTAQVTASSDPLPQILEGIPVAYRDVRVNISRSDFVLNPTSCDPMTLTSTIASISGAVAHPASRFQVAGCQSLAFKPSLKIALKGSTTRTGHPGLKAVVTYPKTGNFANIARAQVNLPHSEFLDQGNLNKTCTKPVLIAGNCPPSSVYGRAKAWTPLLERPLEGPVYLVGGFGYKLPALVAELNGQIRVVLKSKVDTGPNHGIRNTFEAVPDAPVSRFELRLKGGKKYGLLENSEDLCKKPQKAIARFTGQNGAVESTTPIIARSCKRRGGAN